MTFARLVRPLAAAAILFAALPGPEATALQESQPTAEVPADEAAAREAERQQYLAWAQQFLESLDMRTGTIGLRGKLATLETGDAYYFLSPTDTKKVLEEAWGNPPGTGGLGMLFPMRYTPLDQGSWGVTISYEEIGHVEDDDAADIDYDDLLAEMKDDVAAENTERERAGYERIQLVGWAQPPYYDAVHKKLHWAKEIKFGDMATNTLNYNVRILGRKGVLVMNFIASMDQLAEISGEIDSVLAATNFETGNLYSDFDPKLDTVAAVGVGGLIAGKVLAKTGLLAGFLIFAKKLWFLIVAGIAALFRRASNKAATQKSTKSTGMTALVEKAANEPEASNPADSNDGTDPKDPTKEPA